MKRSLIVLLALLCAASFVFAADKSSSALTPWVDKGELLVNAGVGWGGLAGGAEFTLARIDIGGVIPLTFGAAARAAIDPGIFDANWTTFAAGAFGTGHFGFKNVNLPSGLSWFSNFDAYAGLGLGFASGSSTYYTSIKPGFGLSTFEGAAYYLNSKLALNFEYGYIGRVAYWSGFYYPIWYSTVGAILKL